MVCLKYSSYLLLYKPCSSNRQLSPTEVQFLLDNCQFHILILPYNRHHCRNHLHLCHTICLKCSSYLLLYNLEDGNEGFKCSWYEPIQPFNRSNYKKANRYLGNLWRKDPNCDEFHGSLPLRNYPEVGNPLVYIALILHTQPHIQTRHTWHLVSRDSYIRQHFYLGIS